MAKKDLHITVGYIGHVEEVLLPPLLDALEGLSMEKAIPLSFNALDTFGYGHNSRHYLGISILDAPERIKKIHFDIGARMEKMAEIGFSKQRAFHPHITLQLLDHKSPEALKEGLRNRFLSQEITPFTFEVKKLALLYKCPQLKSYISVSEYELEG